MGGLRARSTGITIALTLALAVGLSFAPVPDAYRPFPSLAREPLAEAVASLLLPERGGARAQEVITGEPVVAEASPDAPLAEESEEEIQATREAAAEAAAETAGAGAPPSPAATLGADSLRYLPVESIARAVGFDNDQLCQACITGKYPTPHGEKMYQIAAEVAGCAAASGERTYERRAAVTAK